MPMILDLPVLMSPPGPHAHGRNPPAASPAFMVNAALPLAGVTVLLVEDSRFASDALRLMCRRSGARLRRADCLLQARTHLRTYQPDAVIVDLGLPDGRGEELIFDLRRGCSNVVIIGLSGDPSGERAAKAAGANGFFAKPLPSLGAFQTMLLRHLPQRFAFAAEGGGARVAPDPLSLRDDLAHAAYLLGQAGPELGTEAGAEARNYICTFLIGVGRSAGDAALVDAAHQCAAPEAGRDAFTHLRDVLGARLHGGRIL